MQEAAHIFYDLYYEEVVKTNPNVFTWSQLPEAAKAGWRRIVEKFMDVI